MDPVQLADALIRDIDGCRAGQSDNRGALRCYIHSVPEGYSRSRRELIQSIHAHDRADHLVALALDYPGRELTYNVLPRILIELFENNRQVICARIPPGKRAAGVDLVLLGRDHIYGVNSISPVVLPTWFPVAPGAEAELRIQRVDPVLRGAPAAASTLAELQSIAGPFESRLRELVRTRSESSAVTSLAATLKNLEKHCDLASVAVSSLERVESFRPNVNFRKASPSLVSALCLIATRVPRAELRRHGRAVQEVFFPERDLVSESLLLDARDLLLGEVDRIENPTPNLEAGMALPLATFRIARFLNIHHHMGDYTWVGEVKLRSDLDLLTHFCRHAMKMWEGTGIA